MWLVFLNAFFALTSRKLQFFMDKLASQIAWMPCTSPSIPTFNLAQSWFSWHTLVSLIPLTFRTHLDKRNLQVYPTPTGWIPGCFSSLSRRPDINAQQAAQGRFLLASQLTKISTLLRFIFLFSPNFKIHPFRASECVPLGPGLPESFHAKNSTTPSIISTGIKVGIFLYTSNVEQFFFMRIFPRQNRCDGFLHKTCFILRHFVG